MSLSLGSPIIYRRSGGAREKVVQEVSLPLAESLLRSRDIISGKRKTSEWKIGHIKLKLKTGEGVLEERERKYKERRKEDEARRENRKVEPNAIAIQNGSVLIASFSPALHSMVQADRVLQAWREFRYITPAAPALPPALHCMQWSQASILF